MSWLGCTPDGCDLRWVEQGLQDHAILFCFLLQDTQFICGRLGSVEMEFDPNGFEPDWHFFRDSQGSLQVHVAVGTYVDMPYRDSHGSRTSWQVS